jgi:pimeloyl-ACP methyl ester carboxylesterase
MSPLVLVHGLLGSLEYFDPQSYFPVTKVLCPELHGYGGLACIDDLSLYDQADFVNQFLEQNHIQEPCWLLGHSVGGAIVNLFTEKYPEKVKGIINVEGNFSLQDAFWCQSISKKNTDDWEKEYQQLKRDPEAWLVDADVKPSIERIAWAENILQYQGANTISSVAKAVVRDTDSDQYKKTLDFLAESSIPTYLVAGEHSVNDWFVPDNIKINVKEFHVMPDVGHMMMLEKPSEFCELIKSIIK